MKNKKRNPSKKSNSTPQNGSPRFFKPKADNEHGCNQNVSVNVTIEQADDGIAECLSGCFSACFGLAKKGATA